MKTILRISAVCMLFAGSALALTGERMAEIPLDKMSAAQRSISIDSKTRWITVERGEVVKFIANGQEFAWAFNGMSSSFDLNRIAPTRTLNRDLKVYVWPNAEDLADK